MNRRRALGVLAGGMAGMAAPARAVWASDPGLRPADVAFLEELEAAACRYFYEQASPENGQVLDRARFEGLDGQLDSRPMSSIAATGFGLAALCVAHRRGYLPADAVERRVERTLSFHADQLVQEHGFFCHFNDVHTGKPWHDVEFSSIDTSLLLCGVLTARAYFHRNALIVRDATRIYERVDWPWMLAKGTQQFSMGWKRPSGFLDATWSHYCELMMIPLLAMGSPTHPVDAAVWSAWSRPEMQYQGMRWIGAKDPLFVHQYSHAWFDFRGKRDAFANYFANSVTATRAHRAFCLAWGKPYSAEYWGVSASDSEHGYRAWGGPPEFGGVDGSVVPCAAAGSLAFCPAECLQTLRSLKQRFGEKAWGRYGFRDAFHPDAPWYDPDVLGIDLGIGMLMAENLRSGFVWEVFGRNPEVAVGMRKAGFRAV